MYFGVSFLAFAFTMNCNSQITSERGLVCDYVSQRHHQTVEDRVYVQYGDLNPPCYGQPMEWKETPGPLPGCPFLGNVYEQSHQLEKPAVRVRASRLPAMLNLPCQSSNNWDYNQCYSYYANGCYNTCQFVNVGDMEDFM